MCLTHGPGLLGRLALVFGVAPQLFAGVPRRLADASLALVHAARTFGQVPLLFGDYTLLLGDHPLALGHRALGYRDVALLLCHLELLLRQLDPVPCQRFRPVGAGSGGVGPHLYLTPGYQTNRGQLGPADGPFQHLLRK
jgi:hypothetical protein